MLVYDVSDQKSADSVEYWVRNIRSHASETVQLALIGNKIDLRNSTSTPLSPLSSVLQPTPSSSSSSQQTTTNNTTTAAAEIGATDSPTVTPRACVDCDYGRALSSKYGVAFFETSAKDSSNVNDAYSTLVEQIVDSYLSPPTGTPGLTRRATASLLDGRKDKTSKNNSNNKDSNNKNMKDKESLEKASQITGGSPSSSSGGGGLFSSLRRPGEHRRHSSTSSLMNSLKAKSGLPISISNNTNTNGLQQQSHDDDKEKCCVS